MKNEYEIRGDVAVIFVSHKRKRKKLETVIDIGDLEMAMSLPGIWCTTYSERSESFYVIGWMKPYKNRPKGMTVNLSRYLFGEDVPDEMVVDHINHDTLDNRRSCNLRVVTEQVNRHNRKPKKRSRRKTKTG